MLAFGLFRKEIKNEIYSLRASEVIDDVDVDIISPRNAAEATINGLGVSYTLNKLRFLPGFLSDLGFSFNYSYLDGKTEIVDQDGNSRPLDFLPRMADQTINTAFDF